jgi:hypothetical protein
MINKLKDFLYKIGLVKNELCEYVLCSPENINLFLRDANYTKYEFIKPKLSKTSYNFEEDLEQFFN